MKQEIWSGSKLFAFLWPLTQLVDLTYMHKSLQAAVGETDSSIEVSFKLGKPVCDDNYIYVTTTSQNCTGKVSALSLSLSLFRNNDI